MVYCNDGFVPNFTSGFLTVATNGGFMFLSKSWKFQVSVNCAQFCVVIIKSILLTFLPFIEIPNSSLTKSNIPLSKSACKIDLGK